MRLQRMLPRAARHETWLCFLIISGCTQGSESAGGEFVLLEESAKCHEVARDVIIDGEDI